MTGADGEIRTPDRRFTSVFDFGSLLRAVVQRDPGSSSAIDVKIDVKSRGRRAQKTDDSQPSGAATRPTASGRAAGSEAAARLGVRRRADWRRARFSITRSRRPRKDTSTVRSRRRGHPGTRQSTNACRLLGGPRIQIAFCRPTAYRFADASPFGGCTASPNHQ
jgi:hypothetical protein